MERMPIISIIIPVYNVEQDIRRCLNSVLAQSYKEFEAIVVDDGSTDNSGAICDEYARKDKRIKVFHKENGGLPSARNYGLDHIDVQTDFVCFIDSDDYVEQFWLQDYVDNYNGEDVLFQNAHWWKGSEIMLERKVAMDPSMSLFDKIKTLVERNTLYVWSAMWNADIIRQYNLRFPNYQYWEDVGFCFLYYKYCKSINIIPNERLHGYNYNYFYPITERKYNTVGVKWFDVKIDVLNQWWHLCQVYGQEQKYNNYGIGIMQDIYSKLLEVYKNNMLESNERGRILSSIHRIEKKVMLPWRPLKIKITSIFFSLKISKLLSYF